MVDLPALSSCVDLDGCGFPVFHACWEAGTLEPDLILVVGGVARTRRGFREQELFCQVSPFIFPVLEPFPSSDGGVWKQPKVPSTVADGHGFGVRAPTRASTQPLTVHHGRVAFEWFRVL